MQNQTITGGVRIADDDIYLQETWYKTPKEQFKQIYSFLDLDNADESTSLCDVGCAIGEFLYFVQQNKPKMELSGCDVSEPMLERAGGILPSAKFFKAPIDEPGSLKENSYDIVTMSGVIAILDDPEVALNNCINATKAGGRVLVFSSFNPHPIDVVIRYKRSDQENSPWESGWNIHSKYTAEKVIKNHPKVKRFEWKDFTMPFAIPPKDDPMRCWTTQVGDKEHFQINGAAQLLDMKMLLIECE
ncbi:MAG: class I SAM-dependent methyltransferase [Rickettsiales bacterium]